MPNNFGINSSNAESNPIYNALFEQYFSQYGNDQRARQAALNAQNYYTSQPSAMDMVSPLSFSSADEEDYLKRLAYGGNPYMEQQRQVLSNTIGNQRRLANEETTQRLAQTGLSRSGVGANAYVQNNATAQNALAQGEAQLGQAEMGFRNQAVAQLLGINQFKTGLQQQNQAAKLQAFGLDRSYLQDILGNAERQRQFNSQINAQKEASDNQMWSTIGTGLGMLAGNLLLPGIGGVIGGAIGGSVMPGNSFNSGRA